MTKERWAYIKALTVHERVGFYKENARRQLRKATGLSPRQWRNAVKEGRRNYRASLQN